jgi:hypothetical protein
LVVSAKQPDALLAACYEDEARSKMIGWVRNNLDSFGRLRSQALMIQPPDQCPDLLAEKK